MDVERTEEFENALEWMRDSERNVFLTGKAGTGKSTLLEYFRDHSDKNLAVLAPTGVAAVNVRGQTIHSFFGFGPDVTVQQVSEGVYDPSDDEKYSNLDVLVIDEVSMVRADIMDCIGQFLRRNGPDSSEPLGGIKTILIGDPFQLEPVHTGEESEYFEEQYESPWFFDSHVFDELDCRMVELTTIHRQHDEQFVNILNGIRTRTITDEQMETLNDRVRPDDEPIGEDYYVHLTPTNKPAREINRTRLSDLDGDPVPFQATISGEFDLSRTPTQEELHLKPGAQVMMLNNDSSGRWVNGTMGRVLEITPDEPMVEVRLEHGGVVDVEPYPWQMIEFDYDGSAGRLTPRVLGSFEQMPLRLSWAVTIHKSQGKTLDHVILDTRKSGMFAHGQAYVALSRCTSLDGLVLKKPLSMKDVWMDYRVVNFFKEYQLSQEDEMDEAETRRRLKEAIDANADVEIVYVNSRGEKSRRIIRPRDVGTFQYMGNSYQGVDAYSHKHDEPRQYSLDRVARVHPVPEEEAVEP